MRSAAPLVVLMVALAAAGAAGQGRPADDEASGALARARAAWTQGRFPEALAESRRAATLAPGSLAPVLAHARTAEVMGELDEAAAAYAKAESLAPGEESVLFAGASFAHRVGDDAGALARLDRALGIQPWRARVLYTYGPARLQPWLLRDTPALAEIVRLRIDMAMERGDLALARTLARTYGAVEDGKPHCQDAVTVMRKELGPEVLRALRLAALGESGNAHCIWWLGQTITDEGYVRLGRVLVLEATRLVANQPALRESGERYLRIRLGNGREVPKRAEQLFIIGRQRYLRDRDAEGAGRLFTEALRLAPHFARPYNYLARLAWDRGDREGAVVWLRRALEVDAESWRTHRNLGKTLEVLGRLEDAEVHLRRTVDLFDDDAGGRFALARVLYARGQFDDYVEHTQRAIRFAQSYQDDVRPASAFLASYRIAGPGRALPPAPDPPLIRGWLYD